MKKKLQPLNLRKRTRGLVEHSSGWAFVLVNKAGAEQFVTEYSAIAANRRGKIVLMQSELDALDYLRTLPAGSYMVNVSITVSEYDRMLRVRKEV